MLLSCGHRTVSIFFSSNSFVSAATLSILRRPFEDYQSATVIFQFLSKRRRTVPRFFPPLRGSRGAIYYPIVPRDAKTVRFRRHVEKILAGRVRVPKNASFTETFVRELVKFPHGHDDQVDAMTQFMDWLERQEETDFSKPNVAQRPLGVRTREPDYGASIPTRTHLRNRRDEILPAAGWLSIAKPQLYNPPFPEVKAWVTY